MQEGRGLWETREMSSILRDKSPAIPSTACPWSLHCSGPCTQGASVSPTVPEARAHTGMQKTYRRGCYYNTHNHCEVRTAASWAWSEMARLKERFSILHGRYGKYIVTSVLSGHWWSETDPVCTPLSVKINSLEPKYGRAPYIYSSHL